LLEAVAREQLLKTQQAEKDLAGDVVICELWRLTMAIKLFVVPDHMYQWSIYPFSNPKPRL
jgi:hypothetical protein